MNIKKWFSFSEVVTKKEYWITLSILIISTVLLEILGVLIFLQFATFTKETIHSILFYSLIVGLLIIVGLIFLITWLEFALLAKRCNSIGISKYWSILLFVPYINFITIIVIGLKKTKTI